MAPSGKAAYWTGDGLRKVTGDLEIVGKGAGATTLRMLPGTSGTRDRFLEIAPGVSVQVKAVGIGAGGWGGHAGLGGAVLDRGQLEVFDTTFQYNVAARDGGAIFNDAFATATISTSHFMVNSAGGTQQNYGGHGGALFNAPAATATVRNSNMTSNHAYGTVSGHGGCGGAIFNFWGTVSVINDGVASNFVIAASSCPGPAPASASRRRYDTDCTRWHHPIGGALAKRAAAPLDSLDCHDCVRKATVAASASLDTPRTIQAPAHFAMISPPPDTGAAWRSGW